MYTVSNLPALLLPTLSCSSSIPSVNFGIRYIIPIGSAIMRICKKNLGMSIEIAIADSIRSEVHKKVPLDS